MPLSSIRCRIQRFFNLDATCSKPAATKAKREDDHFSGLDYFDYHRVKQEAAEMDARMAKRARMTKPEREADDKRRLAEATEYLRTHDSEGARIQPSIYEQISPAAREAFKDFDLATRGYNMHEDDLATPTLQKWGRKLEALHTTLIGLGCKSGSPEMKLYERERQLFLSNQANSDVDEYAYIHRPTAAPPIIDGIQMSDPDEAEEERALREEGIQPAAALEQRKVEVRAMFDRIRQENKGPNSREFRDWEFADRRLAQDIQARREKYSVYP